MSTQARDYNTRLRFLLDQNCQPGDIKHVCHELDIDYESLPNGTWLLKQNSLIRHCARQGRLEEMIAQLRALKPDVSWPAVPPAEQQIRDQEIEAGPQNGGEASLQRLLDELQGLLREERGNDPEADEQLASYLSRSVTETLLQLDSQRKIELLRLLYDSNLIVGQSPPISLEGADLRHVDLGWLRFPEINLEGALLFGADLSLCNLRGAHLARADLRQAIVKALLADADLSGADLSEAELSGAKLSGANMAGAILRMAELSAADLSKTDLTGADLTLANLSEANLSSADLSGARLDNANLTATNLRAATLDQVNMSGTAVDQKQLQQAGSMKGAVLIPRKSNAFG